MDELELAEYYADEIEAKEREEYALSEKLSRDRDDD